MAQVIEFYIPESFRRKTKWVPAEQRGKLVDFPRSILENRDRYPYRLTASQTTYADAFIVMIVLTASLRLNHGLVRRQTLKSLQRSARDFFLRPFVPAIQ